MKTEIETLLEEEGIKEDTCIIRCSSGKVINLPKKLLDEIGWKINQEVVWSVATYGANGKIDKMFVEIETVDDYLKDYFPINTKEKQ